MPNLCMKLFLAAPDDIWFDFEIFNPLLLFLARILFPCKILKFGAKRYSFGEKIGEKLLFSDFRPPFDP